MRWSTRRTSESLTGSSSADFKSRFVEMFGLLSDSTTGVWERLPLSDCVNSIDTGKSLNCSDQPRVEGGCGVLKLSALSSGSFLSSENKAIGRDAFVPEKEVKSGDILFARKNTPALVGACVLVQEETQGLMFPDLIFRMRANDKCAGVYLKTLLSDSAFSVEVKKLAHGSAQSMSNIPKAKLARLEIPVPPIELQNEFATFVKQVDKSVFA